MIYDMIMEELNSRESYKASVYAPYYICSFATHVFNLMNRKNEIYWDSKRLPNMRLHVMFVAPPGYMKSYYLSTMGGDDYGVFQHSGVDIGYEQAMTEAGFIGTIVNMNGIGLPTQGAAETFKNGLLLIDEFSAITSALKNQINSQLDTQLLAALDHGKVFKRLSTGKIEYTTSLTLWAGVQPARYDLSSGLGRRLCFLLFLPNRFDNEALLTTVHKTRNLKPNKMEIQKMWGVIKGFVGKMDTIKRVEFDDSVLAKYRELGLFSYESSYFDRLLLGYYLAKFGVDTTIHIDMKDKELNNLLDKEKKWRDEISRGVDYVQLIKIIETFGNSVEINTLVTEALMVGWNAAQVHEMLGEMRKFNMVSIKGKIVTLT